MKDLDGDHIDDIIVSNNGRSRIDLLLSTKKTADETAARPFRTDVNELKYDNRMRLVSIPVNKEIVSVDTGDFNGDGKPDLVFYGTPAEVQVLINGGQGRFASPKKVNTGDAVERASALAVGDLDQDGRDDLALLAEKELIFVYQTTPGTLSEPERVPHTATSPWLLKAVDLDGNGAVDLAILDSETDHPHPCPVRHSGEEARTRAAVRPGDPPRDRVRTGRRQGGRRDPGRRRSVEPGQSAGPSTSQAPATTTNVVGSSTSPCLRGTNAADR